MPVVIGQAIVTPCFFASAARISVMVMSLPRGTRAITASTSTGAGMTIVPLPQRVDILPSILPTLGRPLLSASFWRHDFREGMGGNYPTNAAGGQFFVEGTPSLPIYPTSRSFRH